MIGFFFLAAYTSKTTWGNLKRKKRINDAKLSELAIERSALLKEIEDSIPVA